MPTKKGYWFPAKRYGWGWGFPVTWQGWATSTLWLAIVVSARIRFIPGSIGWFLAVVVAATALLLLVCYLKGEPPSWRWGDKD